MENKTVFKVGQDVYCGLFEKWGKVVKINKNEQFHIVVDWGCNNYDRYTHDGRYRLDFVPTLSFTEYKIQGVDQTPPRKPYEVGDVVYCATRKGAGKVIRIEESGQHPVIVEFPNEICITYSYSSCGSNYYPNLPPSLSYTPYDYKNGGFT